MCVCVCVCVCVMDNGKDPVFNVIEWILLNQKAIPINLKLLLYKTHLFCGGCVQSRWKQTQQGTQNRPNLRNFIG